MTNRLVSQSEIRGGDLKGEKTMADKYIAVGSVGNFLPEQEVTGLPKARMDELVEAGVVRLDSAKAKDTDPDKETTKK